MSDQTSQSITVFSTPTCPWCVRVKQYLQQHDFQFKDVNVAQDQTAALTMVRRSGQMGVPQIWINNEVIVGFDQGRINQLLGIK